MADPSRHLYRRTGELRQADFLKQASATLGRNVLHDAVKLPQGEDLNEWLAVNVVDFFNQANMLYGTITESCTDQSCPAMTAGPKFEYTWTENDQAISCTAPVYIDYLFSSIQDELDDETVFPSQIGKSFPSTFLRTVKTIAKRIFRVYAHVYHEHFDLISNLKSTEHLNTSFKHFMLFVQEFKLIEPTDLEPLQALINELIPSMLLNGNSKLHGVS
uniref:MOB kinase activator-like 1 n=1 Tax=Panagrellus redivivus TaxID=6233 RepID=A0A7E4VCC9_PANRE